MRYLLQSLSIFVLTLLMVSCNINNKPSNSSEIPGESNDTVSNVPSFPGVTQDEQDNNDNSVSSKNIIGKWVLTGELLLVIYEQNGHYFADNINNGVWMDYPYELVKTTINGNLGFEPVEIDEYSESYEIREHGVFAKNMDGTGGQLFKNAK